MITVRTPQDLSAYIGQPFGSKAGMAVTHDLIQAFLDISNDRQAIHTRQTDAVVPGNMLLSLVPALMQQCVTVQTFQTCMTIGYTHVKFRHPVTTGQHIYLTGTIQKVRKFGLKIIIETHCILKTIDTNAVEIVVKDLYE